MSRPTKPPICDGFLGPNGRMLAFFGHVPWFALFRAAITHRVAKHRCAFCHNRIFCLAISSAIVRPARTAAALSTSDRSTNNPPLASAIPSCRNCSSPRANEGRFLFPGRESSLGTLRWARHPICRKRAAGSRAYKKPAILGRSKLLKGQNKKKRGVAARKLRFARKLGAQMPRQGQHRPWSLLAAARDHVVRGRQINRLPCHGCFKAGCGGAPDRINLIRLWAQRRQAPWAWAVRAATILAGDRAGIIRFRESSVS